jgi:hypothetical protein
MKKIDWDFEMNERATRRDEQRLARRDDLIWFLASLAFACFLAGFMAVMTGCGDRPMDPTGVWKTTITWTDGSCNLTGDRDATVTVARVGNTYAVDEHGSTVSGNVTCSSDRCRLVFTEQGPVSDGVLTLHVDLTAYDTDLIVGAGSATFRNAPLSCDQDFLAAGRLLR